MAVQKINIKGTGNHALRPTIIVDKDGGLTERWTHKGSYADLKAKLLADRYSNRSLTLTPGDGQEGILTINGEPQSPASERKKKQVTVEILWMELRKPVETNEYFDEPYMDAAMIASIRAAAEDGSGSPSADPVITKLYDLYFKQTFEYAIGYPVIRRTTTNVRGDVNGGKAYFRDTPPIKAGGDWEYLKTADERRADGLSYTRIEEWTGATIWDEILYPAS